MVSKATQTRRMKRYVVDKRRADAAGFKPRGETAWVPVSALFADPQYQRDVDMKFVQRMASEFDPDALGVICVSDRGNGTYAVLDGFHRVALMRYLEWGDQMMPAEIFTGLKRSEEAEIYTRRNKDRRRQHPVDLHRGEVAAKRPAALALQAVFDETGVRVIRGGIAPDSLRAISTAQKIFAIAGPKPLMRALLILGKAWSQHNDTYNGEVLSGLALLIYVEEDLDDGHMVNRLADLTPGMVVNKAKIAMEVLEGKVAAGSMAHVLTGLYNQRRRSRRLGTFYYGGWPKVSPNGVRYGYGWTDAPETIEEEK